MKSTVIVFSLSLVLSCLVSSIAQSLHWQASTLPYPWPTGIKDLCESSFGLKREDFALPEINYTSENRNSMYMTRIDDSNEQRNVEFPFGANN